MQALLFLLGLAWFASSPYPALGQAPEPPSAGFRFAYVECRLG